MLYILARGREQKTLQVRQNPAGAGYQLLITENDQQVDESYRDLPSLLLREHQLVTAWRAAGWREAVVPRVSTNSRDRLRQGLQDRRTRHNSHGSDK
jgi:hypothetical protein